MSSPLLSICIPTYNRCANLSHTLETIVSANGFGDEVEIVISDNASTDETPIVAQRYAERYPNIRYYRNEENIRDSNFPLSLDRGTGEFRQLMNDNRLICDDALIFMLDSIKKHLMDRTPLFFTCGNIFHFNKNADECVCNSLDDFVIHVSYFSTAIWAFGSWREDWDKVEDKMKYSPLQLSQQDWFYQIVNNRGKAIIKLKIWSKSESFGVKRGYNLFKIHIDNYYTIMRPYILNGIITGKAYNTDRRIQLKRIKYMLVSACLCNVMPANIQFELEGARSIIWKNFKSLPYFYWYIFTSPIWAAKIIIWRKFLK